MDRVSIVLAGLGGYGATYVNALLDAADKSNFCLVGAVDPYPEICSRLEELKANGVSLFSSLDEFYKNNHAELAVISSPIQFHGFQICLALSHGSHVLCEKPLCATADDGRRIVNASAKAGCFVAIGYQWSFSDAILNLKRDILKGEFGKPVRMKTLVLWPRDKSYFQRSWAGKKYSNDGIGIFDSIANNAAAHYLHNMLFVLGDRINKSILPNAIITELYRANNIENFDTIALKMETEKCNELYFFASHAIDTTINPTFHYIFENAKMIYSDSITGEDIHVIYNDGHKVNYGSPNHEPLRKLWHAINAVRTGVQLPCVSETALPHTLCIDAIQRSISDIPYFPKEMICENKSGTIYSDGLGNSLSDCYEKWLLPWDNKLPWAYRGSYIKIRHHTIIT